MANFVVASNRGPASFVHEGGRLVARRGAGGLVSVLAPLLAGTGATWVAAPLTQADREAASAGLWDAAPPARVQPVRAEARDLATAYDVVSNSTLWFLHHGLFDLPRRPLFDRTWEQAWSAYRRVNRAFAQTVSEVAPEGGTVLLQDYHLSLAGGFLARLRPDLATVHFSHTAFADPASMRVLPEEHALEMLGAMAANRACGFLARRWADAFEGCCREVLGAVPPTFVSPIGPDSAHTKGLSEGEDVRREEAWLRKRTQGKRLLVRVDRMEPSKNILRGFLAYEQLLAAQPALRGEVVFVAIAYASRQRLPEYVAYRAEVEALVDRINRRWGGGGWEPVLLELSDNHPRSLAALKAYDVLLVNPVRDGMNLVAKEGPLLNENDGVLVLSREAGAYEELAGGAIGINPYDVSATTRALLAALSMGREERRRRGRELRRATEARNPRMWLEDQLQAAQAPPTKP